MGTLNDKNEITEKNIHIMITSLCDRFCPYCCNKQYDLTTIPYVTKEELKNAENVFLTGGEPFAYGNPCAIASKLKKEYVNIKNIYVYTNAYELAIYLKNYHSLYAIDGVTVSIKNELDKSYFYSRIIDNIDIRKMKSNWLYVFPGFDVKDTGNFIKKQRIWQENFQPAPDSIFRRI